MAGIRTLTMTEGRQSTKIDGWRSFHGAACSNCAATGREDLLLQVAAQLEQAAPWKDRQPSIFVA